MVRIRCVVTDLTLVSSLNRDVTFHWTTEFVEKTSKYSCAKPLTCKEEGHTHELSFSYDFVLKTS
jgi:hypothetical protein